MSFSPPNPSITNICMTEWLRNTKLTLNIRLCYQTFTHKSQVGFRGCLRPTLTHAFATVKVKLKFVWVLNLSLWKIFLTNIECLSKIKLLLYILAYESWSKNETLLLKRLVLKTYWLVDNTWQLLQIQMKSTEIESVCCLQNWELMNK